MQQVSSEKIGAIMKDVSSKICDRWAIPEVALSKHYVVRLAIFWCQFRFLEVAIPGQDSKYYFRQIHSHTDSESEVLDVTLYARLHSCELKKTRDRYFTNAVESVLAEVLKKFNNE